MSGKDIQCPGPDITQLDSALRLPSLGKSTDEQWNTLVQSHAVVVLGHSWCPYSLEAVRVCNKLGIESFAFCSLDKHAGGPQLRAALVEATKQRTDPYIFINQAFIGGCDDLKTLQYEGQLASMIRTAAAPKQDMEAATGPFATIDRSAVAVGTPPAPMTLFDFPAVADERVIRLVSVFVVLTCLAAAVGFREPWAVWLMGGTMVDYVLRIWGGANISVAGSLAQVIVAVMERFGSEPKWIAGPPKQFASFCGWMFSFLAFLFHLLAVHVFELKYVALSFTCGLAVATGLEGFVGFCLGCWMFKMAIRMGLVAPEVYMVYANSRDEVAYTWYEVNKRLGEARPGAATVPFNPAQETVVDLKYKPKTDDTTREDFDVARHTKIAHFGMHLGLAGLAVAWQVAADVLPSCSKTVSYVLALISAALYVLWLGLYAFRAFEFERKIAKEWHCSLRGNFFGAMLVTSVLLASLAAPHSAELAKVLFWLGAPAAMLLSIVRVGDWIATRKDLEHVNAAWLILPVGNFVAALVGPGLDQAYVPAMQFWFAFALMLWVLLFAITFAKAIIMTDNDDRMRPLLLIWAAAPAVASVAYLTTFGAQANLQVFILLHWMAVGIFLVLLWCCYRPFMGRIPFDMSIWAAGFPTAALAVSSLTYYQVMPGDLSYGIAVTALAGSSVVNGVLLLQTVAAVIRRRGVFTPEYKWGPLSFMRLTHEAFRVAILNLLRCAEEVAAGSDSTGAAITELCEQWRLFKLAHDEHSKHEDDVIFKAFDDLFPGVAQQYHVEHEAGEAAAAMMDERLQQISEAWRAGEKGTVTALASETLLELRGLTEAMLTHLRSEEDHMQPIGRRYVPLAMHKKLVAKVFESTDASAWYELLPWILAHLPMRQQRVRYLKTFLWAMPERAQQLGTMVALGSDPVQWATLAAELPEMVPRGAPGWARFH